MVALVLPLRDENPTLRTPVVTVLIILLCIGTWFLAQSGLRGTTEIPTEAGRVRIDEQLRFNLQYAAVPCEIVRQRPLVLQEIADTYSRGDPAACEADPDTPALFPGKVVLAAVVTSMFLHGGLFHLASNMLFLWIFGNNIEDRMGHVRFALFYVLGGIAATVGFVLSQPDATVTLVGASGAVAAVMGAYLVWFPRAPIRTLIFLFLVDIRARWYLLFWFGMQFFTAPGSGVAWMAHVAGFAFGVLAGLVARAARPPLLVPRDRADRRWWDPTGGVGRGPYAQPSSWMGRR
jgi:membrane associated rhomboid family serine protease